jgi:hypothetical protein
MGKTPDLFEHASNPLGGAGALEASELDVTLEAALGRILFQWHSPPDPKVLAEGTLTAQAWIYPLRWECTNLNGVAVHRNVTDTGSSVGSLLRQLRQAYPIREQGLRVSIRPNENFRTCEAGQLYQVGAKFDAWKLLAQLILRFAKCVRWKAGHSSRAELGAVAAKVLAEAWLADTRLFSSESGSAHVTGPAEHKLQALVTLSPSQMLIRIEWTQGSHQLAWWNNQAGFGRPT